MGWLWNQEADPKEELDSQTLEKVWRWRSETGIQIAETASPEKPAPPLLETCRKPDLRWRDKSNLLQEEVLVLHQSKKNWGDGTLSTQKYWETHYRPQRTSPASQ